MWGAEKTLFVSGIVVMLGHIALSLIPGVTGLLIGLPLIALGSGGVKPTASTMVGSLYESEERRVLRDAGFSIFYISVNIGSFFDPLITGLLQDRIGFHFGFGAAAVGMAVGLAIYSQTRRALPLTPPPNPLPTSQKNHSGSDCHCRRGGAGVDGGNGLAECGQFFQSAAYLRVAGGGDVFSAPVC